MKKQMMNYSEFENYAVPALRGKDYGKSKMSYPDYNETQSGLQYKVALLKSNFFICILNFLSVFISFISLSGEDCRTCV